MLVFGPRSAMGFFQLPMLSETGWDRSTFGLAMALQNLFWGLSQPFFGAIADRFGTARVLVASGVLYAAGLLLMAHGTAPVWLHVGGGMLVGLAVGAGSFSVILSAFARNVTPQQRSMAFGIGTAAGSAGMFLFAPLSQTLINLYGWSDSLVIMGGLMLIIPLLAFPLKGNANSGTQSASSVQQSVGKRCGRRSHTRAICCWSAAFLSAVSRWRSSQRTSRPISAISVSMRNTPSSPWPSSAFSTSLARWARAGSVSDIRNPISWPISISAGQLP